MSAYRRKSLRIPGYDYATPGSYFVTICASDRRQRFSAVTDHDVTLTRPGEMVLEGWMALADRFPAIDLDDIILMPNHLHAILWLQNTDAGASPPRLSQVVQAFKSLTTNRYSKAVREQGWPPFDRRLWQPGYYEHIIRNDRSLDRHREYIAGNPGRWRDRHGTQP